MRILGIDGTEITNPDLSKGYLTTETIVIAHHEAVPETPEKTEVVKIDSEDGILYERKIVQKWQPARGAWDETETIQRYREYTPEELEQREADRKAQEEADIEAQKTAEEAAKKKAAIDALPDRVNDIEEGVAEVGIMAANASTSIDELMEAVAEIGVMVAELQA